MLTTSFMQKKKWKEKKEEMNIKIKCIKTNCSGQGEKKGSVFKSLPGLISKHFLFLI